LLPPNTSPKLYKAADNMREKLFTELVDGTVLHAQSRELGNFDSAPASIHKAPVLLL